MPVKYEFYVFIPRLFPWLFFVYINPLNATPYKTPYDESNNQSINRKALKKERERGPVVTLGCLDQCEISEKVLFLPLLLLLLLLLEVFTISSFFFGAVDETWALVILLLLTTIDKEQ